MPLLQYFMLIRFVWQLTQTEIPQNFTRGAVLTAQEVAQLWSDLENMMQAQGRSMAYAWYNLPSCFACLAMGPIRGLQ